MTNADDDYNELVGDLLLGYLDEEIRPRDRVAEIRLIGRDHGKARRPKPATTRQEIGLDKAAAHLMYCMGWQPYALIPVLREIKPSYIGDVKENARAGKRFNWNPGCPLHPADAPFNPPDLQEIIDRAHPGG